MTEVGKRYGKLVVIEQAESSGHHKRWLCKCDCGEQSVAWQISLRRGTTRSCGCHRRATSKRRWEAFQKEGTGFWIKVDRSGGAEACWTWLGSIRAGYGATSYKGTPMRAHRLAWLLTHGSLPPDAVLRHSCDNKACCNPAHLIPGTQLENIADMVDRGLLKKGQNRGSKNGRAKLTYEAAECIRRAYGLGLSQDMIAEIFNVSQNAVSQIVNFKRYAEPPKDET